MWANPDWWLAVAAYIKDKAEGLIGFCVWVSDELRDRRQA